MVGSSGAIGDLFLSIGRGPRPCGPARAARRCRPALLRSSAASAWASSSRASRARAVQAQQRDVGGLVARGVLAGGLAQRVRIGRDVEDVVDHLEGQAHGRAVVAQRRERAGGDRAAAGRAHLDAALQQRAGLQAMHLAQLRFVERAGRRWPGRSPGRRPCPGCRPRAPAGGTGWPAPRARRSSPSGVSSSKASACSASPASSASASPNFTCTVGLPRRSTSLSMHGRSSCTSE